MSLVALIMNLMLAGLLGAALVMGWRLNQRLKALRDSHEGFAIAVADLNTAAARAEQGLADLRAATDEASDDLSDRIERGRALATRLDRLLEQAPAATRPELDRVVERRLGAMLSAAREPRAERLYRETPSSVAPMRSRSRIEDELFDDEPLSLDVIHGGRQ